MPDNLEFIIRLVDQSGPSQGPLGQGASPSRPPSSPPVTSAASPEASQVAQQGRKYMPQGKYEQGRLDYLAEMKGYGQQLDRLASFGKALGEEEAKLSQRLEAMDVRHPQRRSLLEEQEKLRDRMEDHVETVREAEEEFSVWLEAYQKLTKEQRSVPTGRMDVEKAQAKERTNVSKALLKQAQADLEAEQKQQDKDRADYLKAEEKWSEGESKAARNLINRRAKFTSDMARQFERDSAAAAREAEVVARSQEKVHRDRTKAAEAARTASKESLLGDVAADVKASNLALSAAGKGQAESQKLRTPAGRRPGESQAERVRLRSDAAYRRRREQEIQGGIARENRKQPYLSGEDQERQQRQVVAAAQKKASDYADEIAKQTGQAAEKMRKALADVAARADKEEKAELRHRAGRGGLTYGEKRRDLALRRADPKYRRRREKDDDTAARRRKGPGAVRLVSTFGGPGLGNIVAAFQTGNNLAIGLSVLNTAVGYAERGVKSFGEAAASIASGDAVGLSRAMTGLATQIPLVGGVLGGLGNAVLDVSEGLMANGRRIAQYSAGLSQQFAEYDVRQLLRDIRRANDPDVQRGVQAAMEFRDRMNDLIDKHMPVIVDFMEKGLSVMTSIMQFLSSILPAVEQNTRPPVTTAESDQLIRNMFGDNPLAGFAGRDNAIPQGVAGNISLPGLGI